MQAQIMVLHKQGGGAVRIQLSPPSLGSVRIQLQTQDGGLARLSIVTTRASTAQAVQESMTHLVGALAQAGLQVVQVSVTTVGVPGGGAATASPGGFPGQGHDGQNGSGTHQHPSTWATGTSGGFAQTDIEGQQPVNVRGYA